MVTDFRGICLPYCLQKQKDGSYVILNRNYKPIGFNTSDWINYEDYPISLKMKLTKSTVQLLSIEGGVQGDSLYLYNDGTNPMDSTANMRLYMDKLSILATKDIKQ